MHERANEHKLGLSSLREDSYMLKHALDKHSDGDILKSRFGIKVIEYSRTSFERQVKESVVLQEMKDKHFLLNSKSEYNRCSLPRLTTKLGEREVRENQEEEEMEKAKEMKIVERIRCLRKERNMGRRREEEMEGIAFFVEHSKNKKVEQ